MGCCGIIRIATTVEEANSGTIGGVETTVMSVTGTVINGRTYEIEADFGFRFSAANDVFSVRIREDDAAGALLQRRVFETDLAGQAFLPARVKTRWKATATGSQTFALTFDRDSGAGTMQLIGDALAPSLMWINWPRG